MKYRGTIHEFPGDVAYPLVLGAEVLFITNRQFRALDWTTGTERVIASMVRDELYDAPRPASGGVWYDSVTCSRFYDAFGAGVSYDDAPSGLGGGAFNGNRVVFFDNNNESFSIYNVETGQTRILEKKGNSRARFAADAERIYQHQVGKFVRCFDWDGNELWSQPSVLMHYFHLLGRTPFCHDNVLIVPLGVDRESRKNFQVVALAREDGREVWRKTMTHTPQTIQYLNGRIFLAHDWQMKMLDASSGEILLDAPSGWSAENAQAPEPIRPGLTRTGFYSDGECHFFVSLYHRAIRVFDAAGVQLQELTLPDERALPLGHWRPVYDRFATHAGHSFLTVVLNYGVKGLLHLERGAGGISVVPRPETEIGNVADDNGCHGFRIVVTDSDFDRLVRYGEIAANEVFLYHTADGTDHDHYDVKFNGKVTLELCGTKAPPDGTKDIAEMRAEVLSMCGGLGSRGFDEGRNSRPQLHVELLE